MKLFLWKMPTALLFWIQCAPRCTKSELTFKRVSKNRVVGKIMNSLRGQLAQSYLAWNQWRELGRQLVVHMRPCWNWSKFRFMKMQKLALICLQPPPKSVSSEMRSRGLTKNWVVGRIINRCWSHEPVAWRNFEQNSGFKNFSSIYPLTSCKCLFADCLMASLEPGRYIWGGRILDKFRKIIPSTTFEALEDLPCTLEKILPSALTIVGFFRDLERQIQPFKVRTG